MEIKRCIKCSQNKNENEFDARHMEICSVCLDHMQAQSPVANAYIKLSIDASGEMHRHINIDGIEHADIVFELEKIKLALLSGTVYQN